MAWGLGNAGCPVRTDLSTAEFRVVRDLPNPIWRVKHQVKCEFEAGHVGWHVGLTQESDDVAWWMRWDERSRDLGPMDFCDEAAPEDADDWVCQLPAAHVGRHSYELASVSGARAPTAIAARTRSLPWPTFPNAKSSR